MNILHTAFPHDRKATPSELFQRAETYAITMADVDYETVEAAAYHIIKTQKWHPNPQEILEAVKRVELNKDTEVTPITTAQPIEDEVLNDWLEAFCDWLGFGCEEDETALGRYYEKHPERLSKMREVLHNDE